MKRFALITGILCCLFIVNGWSKEVSPLTPTPEIKLLRLIVDDSVGGNSNGILEPGETAVLDVAVYNAGTATAFNVAFSIDSIDSGVTLLSRVVYLGDIPPSTTFEASGFLKVQVAQTVPCGKDLMLYYTLNASNFWAQGRYHLPMRELKNFYDGSAGVDDGSVILYGTDIADFFGYAIAAGDIDHDKIDDIVISAPLADGQNNLRLDSGEIWIYQPPSFSSAVIYGPEANDQMGDSVSVGNIDGDDQLEIIIGLKNGDGDQNLKTDSGEVWVVNGDAVISASFIDLSTPPPTETTVIYGPDSNDFAGTHVTSGDINGDGYDDVILSAPYGDGPSNGRIDSGEVWVIYGHAGGLSSVIDLNSPPGNTLVIYGVDSNDLFGSSLATGDVNGDGYDDIIIGVEMSDGYANTRIGSGEVWVIFGSDNLTGSLDLFSPPANSMVIYGKEGGDALGYSVSTGDIDGDGYDEIIMGANTAKGVGITYSKSTGVVWILSGGSSLPLSIDLQNPPAGTLIQYGPFQNSLFGDSVLIRDLDMDGYGEIIVGATGGGTSSAGETRIYYGSLDNTDVHYDIPPLNSQVIYGKDVSDSLGTGLTTGMINSDEYPDIIVSSPNGDGSDDSKPDAGEVLIVYSRPRYDYVIKPATYAFIDATIGTALPLSCDSCCTSVPLPFTFEYYGKRYTTVYVCDDGYISFSPVDYPNPINDCMDGSNLKPDNVIAVFWDDLNPSAGGGVYMLTEGTAPNRRITFEWSSVPHFPDVGNATFEVTLFENSNQILMQYQDTNFGDANYDNGASASIGVENANGKLYKSYLCRTANLTPPQAIQYVPIGTYRIYSYDFTSLGTWTASGLWHVESTNCQPSSHSPASSMYYGDTNSCNYNTGGAHSGELTSPTISADYYSKAYYWSRIYIDSSGDNESFEVSKNGGAFTSVFTEHELYQNIWNEFGVDISSNSEATLQLKYSFTADNSGNLNLGWMIDDVEVYGCDVYGTTPIINTLAYARPTPVCETNSYLLDGSGTYVANCSAVSYQWYENGNPISGATGIQHTIPANQHPTGTFSYFLRTTCTATNDYDDSSPISVQVVPMPTTIPRFKLSKVNSGSQIHMIWDNVSGGDIYNIYRDLNPSSSFLTKVASATDGTSGVDIAMPSESQVFYLVAGSNSTCGEGTKK